MITPSWIFTLSPMRMQFTSPLTTALNQMLQSSPISTSPTIVALGATKQFFPKRGDLPSTGSIVAIIERFDCLVNIRTLPSMPPQSDTSRLFLRHVAQTSPDPLGLEIVRAEGLYLYDS